jgi:hypothetical protein
MGTPDIVFQGGCTCRAVRDTARRPGRRGDRVERELAMSWIQSRPEHAIRSAVATAATAGNPVTIQR